MRTFRLGVVLLGEHDVYELLYERVYMRAAAHGVLDEVHGGVDAHGLARVDAQPVLVRELAVHLHRLVEASLRPVDGVFNS